jgi:hypothetical protein
MLPTEPIEHVDFQMFLCRKILHENNNGNMYMKKIKLPPTSGPTIVIPANPHAITPEIESIKSENSAVLSPIIIITITTITIIINK